MRSRYFGPISFTAAMKDLYVPRPPILFQKSPPMSTTDSAGASVVLADTDEAAGSRQIQTFADAAFWVV